MRTYREVAEHYGLRGITADRYVGYMIRRWSDTEEMKCEVGYAGEWAERFLTGAEYEASDMFGKEILREIDGVKK